MARNFFTQTPTAVIALAAGVRTCVGRLNAPANQINVVTGLDLTFDGIVVTGTPVFIEVLRVTSDGVGMTARNPLQTVPKATALQSTGAVGPVSAGNLPTASDVLRTHHAHPQAGILYPFPLGKEIENAGGGRLAIFITAPQAVNVTYVLSGEE
jgi:hypothetical protein